MSNVTNSAGKANRPSYIPPEPAIIHCSKCRFVTHKGEPHCPNCGATATRPKIRSFDESDAWIEQEHRDTIALYRWKTWQQRQSLKIVPPDHSRYAAWMALRCYLLDQAFLRRSDGDVVAHIAAVIVLGVRRDAEGFLWFGDVLLDEDLADDLYAPEHDDKDHGIAGALLSLSALLANPVGSRDDILPFDHKMIVGAFQ